MAFSFPTRSKAELMHHFSEGAAAVEPIELPYRPELNRREIMARLSVVAGLGVVAHVMMAYDLVQALRIGNADVIQGEVIALIALLALDVGVVLLLFWFIRRLRIRFDEQGIIRETRRNEKVLVEWEEVQSVGYTDLGMPVFILRGPTRKYSLMPNTYREPTKICRILRAKIPSRVPLPDRLRSGV